MNITPIPERERLVTLLVEYLAKFAEGSAIGYVDIERDTGVSMQNEAQRRLLRSALRRLKLLYVLKYGWGVILSSADNAEEISSNRFRKARTAIGRFGRTAEALVTKHGPQMTAYNRNILLQDVGLAGALRASAKAHHVTREASLSAGKPPAPMLPKIR